MNPPKILNTPLVLMMIVFSMTCQQQSDRRLSIEDRNNVVDKSAWVESGRVKLIAGEHREVAAPGAASELIIKLTDKLAYGELDRNNAAVVVLATEAGGNGTFYDWAVIAQQSGTPVHFTTTTLDDRLKINLFAIENGEIILKFIG